MARSSPERWKKYSTPSSAAMNPKPRSATSFLMVPCGTFKKVSRRQAKCAVHLHWPKVTVRIASLSPYPEEVVRGLLPGVDRLEIALVPPPPAPDEVRRAVADADLVLADKKHKHRLDRTTLAAMSRCQLVQQPA